MNNNIRFIGYGHELIGAPRPKWSFFLLVHTPVHSDKVRRNFTDWFTCKIARPSSVSSHICTTVYRYIKSQDAITSSK